MWNDGSFLTDKYVTELDLTAPVCVSVFSLIRMILFQEEADHSVYSEVEASRCLDASRSSRLRGVDLNLRERCTSWNELNFHFTADKRE